MALPLVLPRFMLPFMFVAPPPALPFALVLPPAFAFAFMFAFMFEPPVFEFMLVVLPVFEFMFAFMFAFAFVFALALLVFSAGEQAVHTLATARRVRSAKVLRIEFPPVPLAGSVCWGAARATGARFAEALPQQLRVKGFGLQMTRPSGQTAASGEFT